MGTVKRSRYVNSSGYRKYMEQKTAHNKMCKIKKVKKPKSWPKRAMSGYFIFLNSNRKNYMKQLAKRGVTGREAVVEVSRMGGKAWGNLTDKAKTPWLKHATKAKKVADRKMAKFKRGKVYKTYMEAKKEAKRAARAATTA